jgi:hypothetical protein
MKSSASAALASFLSAQVEITLAIIGAAHNPTARVVQQNPSIPSPGSPYDNRKVSIVPGGIFSDSPIAVADNHCCIDIGLITGSKPPTLISEAHPDQRNNHAAGGPRCDSGGHYSDCEQR